MLVSSSCTVNKVGSDGALVSRVTTWRGAAIWALCFLHIFTVPRVGARFGWTARKDNNQ